MARTSGAERIPDADDRAIDRLFDGNADPVPAPPPAPAPDDGNADA